MATSRGFRPLRRAADWEDRFWGALQGAVPQEVRAHLRGARKEVLLAVRAVIDETLTGSQAAPSGRGGRPRKAS